MNYRFRAAKSFWRSWSALSEVQQRAARQAFSIFKTGLSLRDIDDVLDALCATAECQRLEPDWIPRLSDPDDEPLLQMAVEAKVPIIVTVNIRHLKPAESFGIEVLTPAQFLAKLRAGI